MSSYVGSLIFYDCFTFMLIKTLQLFSLNSYPLYFLQSLPYWDPQMMADLSLPILHPVFFPPYSFFLCELQIESNASLCVKHNFFFFFFSNKGKYNLQGG